MSRFNPHRRATFLSLLMLLTLLNAAMGATTTNWSGPSEVEVPSGGGNVTVEGFSIPAGETVTDAWLEVSEDGLTDLGSSTVWRADAPVNSTSAGVFGTARQPTSSTVPSALTPTTQ